MSPSQSDSDTTAERRAPTAAWVSPLQGWMISLLGVVMVLLLLSLLVV